VSHHTAAVIGLGLMGGSLARDLSMQGVRVLGYDTEPRHVESALREGILRQALDGSLSGVREASLVVLAVPVSVAPTVLENVAPLLDNAQVVTDLGSTKRSIVAAAERLGLGPRFIGSHPLAGDHRSGWEASRGGLFRDTVVYLCPTLQTGSEALAAARALWEGVGARTETVDAVEHDRRLAWTSHLHQAVSTALALALSDAHLVPGDLGPAGRSMTRLAASSPEIWTGIALENADALADALLALEERVRSLRESVRRSDSPAIHDAFAEARSWATR
jgi:prephenate dehydrogenase